MTSRAGLARSEAPEDPRPYVRVSTDLPTNPKLDAIDNPAAGWAYVVSLCYSAQSFTDGHFPMRGVLRMANVDESIGMALVEQGLWHLPGHDCERCEQPKQGHVIVHDYLQHQRSAEEVRDLTSKRREAGRKGAASRWNKQVKQAPSSQKKPNPAASTAPKQREPMANAIASAMANGQQDLWQTDSKPMADEMRGDTQTPTGSAEPASPPTASPPGALTVTQRSKRITDAYAEEEPMCKWPAVNGVVIKAVKSGRFTDDEIRDALLRMAKEGRGVTVESLRVELAGFTPRNQQDRRNGHLGSNTHVPYLDPEDQSVYDRPL